jgi:5-methylthioadenosine/S-adenosylhomocysteine deaminase
LDCRGLLAIPGLINAHTHSPEHVLRGTSECVPLEVWLVQQFALRANFPPHLIYLITLAGAAEMLRSGITAVLDHFWMAEGVTLPGLESAMQAYRDSGLRATLAPMLEDQDRMATAAQAANSSLSVLGAEPELQRALVASRLEVLEAFLGKWHGQADGRLRAMPGPGGLQWCSEALLLECGRLAEQYDTGLHMHLSETRLQARVCRQVYGHGAALELDRLGLLGPRTSLAHCIWVDESELDCLGRRGACLVHNPVSNLKLGAGVAAVPEMLRRAVTVALGTDGAASNDSQDMFQTLKLAALLHSPARPGGAWVNAQTALRMATLGGAQALGLAGQVGELRVGCWADLVLLDLSHAYADPLPDAARHIVYCETGDSVRHVLVQGQIVVKDRLWQGSDEVELRRELRAEFSAYEAAHARPARQVQALVLEWDRALAALESGTEQRA